MGLTNDLQETINDMSNNAKIMLGDIFLKEGVAIELYISITAL